MRSATTLTYSSPTFEDDTGDFLSTLAGMFGGGGGGGGNAPNAAGGGIGNTLGGLGGASVAAALGMPQLAPIASSAGSLLGGLAQQGVETLAKPKSRKKPRQLSRNERRIVEQGRAKTKQTGNEAFASEAMLRVQQPAQYKRLRTLGKLPSQTIQVKPVEQPVMQPKTAPMRAQTTPQPVPAAAAQATPQPVARPTLNLAPLFEGLTDVERAQFELAIQEGRGVEAWNRIRGERVEQETRTAPRTFLLGEKSVQEIDYQSLPVVPEMDGYSETSGLPEDRPNPKKHLAIIPLQQAQLEGLLRVVPPLQKIDKRLLRLLAGLGSKARDVSGVDPQRGTYHAASGETATGIAKRLTGRAERVNELFAANPGNQGPIWQIPPGWLTYEPDTGTMTTARRYTVVQNDTPYLVAKKFGAFGSRAKWWTELKAANPEKPTKDKGGNWVSLYAGEIISLPDIWFDGQGQTQPTPPNPQPFPIPPAMPIPPSGPGLPGPWQTGTQDPGVYLQAQALLALWARQNPGACVPSDYGANPTDFTGTATPRTTMALVSFQAWWNRTRPASPLRADGILDEPTYRALYNVTAAQIPTPAPEPPKPAPNPLPQLPPWLTGPFGGVTPGAQLPQIPPWLIPATSTQNLPPWAVPSIPALPPAPPAPPPTPDPSTPAPDDGPAIPLMAMLGAGLFLS